MSEKPKETKNNGKTAEPNRPKGDSSLIYTIEKKREKGKQ